MLFFLQNIHFIVFEKNVFFCKMNCNFDIKKALLMTYCMIIFLSALLWDCSLCWDRWNYTWHLHMTRPCLVALGWVLIWVEHSTIVLAANIKGMHHKPDKSDLALYYANSYKIFLTLSDWCTILRWDSIHHSPRHSFNWIWTSASTNQATTAGLW